MSDHVKSIIFAAILCVVCSALLTAAATGLRPYQAANETLDRQANLLTAVGLLGPDHDLSIDEIQALYHQCIQPAVLTPAGQMVTDAADDGLPMYLYVSDNRIRAYILPVDTRGLWGKIHGYLAIESDGATVAGFTVYRHQETPGLGGEIEQPWFQGNFKGKRIVTAGGVFNPIAVAKGVVVDTIPPAGRVHHVDGISGATLTGRYLTSGLRQILESYEPISGQFRDAAARGEILTIQLRRGDTP